MVLALALVPRSAAAEPWPLRSDPYVTDIAGVLPEDEESRLRAELAALRTETGVAMAVLTLRSRSDYDGSSTLAAFATGVFNAWGIGDGARNDGILVLVATEDRELRITLGAGYDQGYDVLAEDIAARHFLPDLRQGAAARSIMAGSREVMARIARQHAARLLPEAPPVTIAAAESRRMAVLQAWPGTSPGEGNELAFLRYLRARSLSSRRNEAGPGH